MYTCKYCNKSFEKQQCYASHVSRCEKRPEDYKSFKEIVKEKTKGIKNDNNLYVCQYCGKTFEKPQGYTSHSSKCKLNPNRNEAMKHLSYARECKRKTFDKDNNVYICQYCGRECVGKNSLTQHEIRCKENPDRIIANNSNFVSNFIKYNQDCRNGLRHHPHKGQTKDTCESLRKASETKQRQKENGEYKGGFLGKKHTKETKEKMRESALEYLKNVKDFSGPRYNKESIVFINKLNEEKQWNLQHAENGGEIEICGYFVDGYDKELNIVFEYDEPRHYKDIEKSILNEKDIERQNNIIQKLDCEFYRYNEYKKYFYKVK